MRQGEGDTRGNGFFRAEAEGFDAFADAASGVDPCVAHKTSRTWMISAPGMPVPVGLVECTAFHSEAGSLTIQNSRDSGLMRQVQLASNVCAPSHHLPSHQY